MDYMYYCPSECDGGCPWEVCPYLLAGLQNWFFN
nr:MAG: hypothetical protein [Microvirus sp.]